MIKVKISSDRFVDACGIYDYMAVSNGSIDAAMRIIPRFILGEDGEYIVKPVFDEDGDVVSYENIDTAVAKYSVMTPRRATLLAKEIVEAAKQLVNPPNGRVSPTPTSTG